MSGENKIAMLGLRMQMALYRFGWNVPVAAGLLLAGTAGWVMMLPKWEGELEDHRLALARIKRAAPVAAEMRPAAVLHPMDERAQQFYDALGERKLVEQQLKLLFSAAGKAGLTLSQAEYKSAFDKNGDFSTYQIILPVKGPYGAIRKFCELALLALPNASLDELSFQRENVAAGGLEVKIRLTLYLTDRLRAETDGERQTQEGPLESPQAKRPADGQRQGKQS